MKYILFRADGSQELGMGHIMRCIAFAQFFKLKGFEPLFVIREYDGKVRRLIEEYGYKVEMMGANKDILEDAYLTAGLATKYRANLIFTDLNNPRMLKDFTTYTRYIEVLKKSGKFLVMIDGFGPECISEKIRLSSDMVIIPYFGAEKKNYCKNPNTRYLLGPAYFTFREDFLKLSRKKKIIKKIARNILVTMGGSDPSGITPKIAKALSKIGRVCLNLKIVIGKNFKESIKKRVAYILKDFPGEYTLILGTDNMAELLLWADIALLSSGLTKYEAAFFGTPSLVVSQNNNHKKIMKEFEKAKVCLHLGNIKNLDEKNCRKQVIRLLDNFKLRKALFKNARKLVDNKGFNRIFQEIPKGCLYE